MLSVTWQIIPFLIWITYRCFCSDTVCYLPPGSSSKCDCSEEFLIALQHKFLCTYRNLGTICICGDFNARCGDLQDAAKCGWCFGIPPRNPLNVELNSHGKQLMDAMKSLELGTLNGRGKDNFIYIAIKSRLLRCWLLHCWVGRLQQILTLHCYHHARTKGRIGLPG